MTIKYKWVPDGAEHFTLQSDGGARILGYIQRRQSGWWQWQLNENGLVKFATGREPSAIGAARDVHRLIRLATPNKDYSFRRLQALKDAPAVAP